MKFHIQLWLRYYTLLLSALFLSCSDPLTPVLPKWDVDMNVPFIAQTYTMEDLLDQDSTIQISRGEENILIIGKSIPLQSIELGNCLRLEDHTYSFSRPLGTLQFDIPNIVDKYISVGSIFSSLNEGMYVVEAIMNPSPLDIDIDASKYFEEMTFENGKVVFTLRNTLSIPLIFPLPVRILDEQQRELARFTISGTLSPGGTMTLPPFYLDGLTFRNRIVFSIQIATPGSGGNTTEIKKDMGLQLHAAIIDTKIKTATAYLPSQSEEISEVVDITNESGSRILQGNVKSGTLFITVQNHVAVGSSLELVIHEVSFQGEQLRRTMTIAPRAQQTLTVDLAGSELTPLRETDLTYKIAIRTNDASKNLVTVSATDSISVTACLRDIVMANLTGTILPQEIEINQTQSVNLDLSMKLKGTITFSEARMWSVLRNNSALPVQVLDGRVLGQNSSTSQTASIDLPKKPIRGYSESVLQFDNNQVVDFFNTFNTRLPDQISINGSIVLNKEKLYGTATSKDSITGTLYLELPMKITLPDGSILDTSDITMDESSKKKFENVNEGIMHFELENRLPAGVSIDVELLDDRNNLLLSPKAVNGQPLQVASATVNSNGYSTSPAKARTEMKLAGEDFKKLVRSKYARVRLNLNTPGSSPVIFRATDVIKVRVYATLNVNSDFVLK